MPRLAFAVVLLATAASIAMPPVVVRAGAQDGVVITCGSGEACSCTRVYSPTFNGDRSVRVSLSPGDRRSRSVRVATLAGIVRDPATGELRTVREDGGAGDAVTPRPLSRNGAAPGGAPWTFEYRDSRSGKAPISVTPDEFVLFLRGPAVESALVQFLKIQESARSTHPRLEDVTAAVLRFGGESAAFREWREELRGTVDRTLHAYRSDEINPTRIEETLAGALAALRRYKTISPEAVETASENELSTEHERLVQRFLVAAVLEQAGQHDAFLQKLRQLGLARWSRPGLAARAMDALSASATQHHQRALELFAAGQYALAFDEARIAAAHAPCSEEIGDFYNRARVEYVHRNTVPSVPEYDHDNRTVLEQIVRELQSFSREPDLTPERLEYIRRRIAEGERLDASYLPLQLKKAEFLANIGELHASREVVTQVERHMRLARTDAGAWLDMDASLNGSLLTLRKTTERKLREQVANGEFEEALKSAHVGLAAEPENLRFLYFAAVSAAVLREYAQAKAFAKRYLRLVTTDCGATEDTVATVIEIAGLEPTVTAVSKSDSTPNWISGAVHVPGSVFYDPVSGSFNSRIITSTATKGVVVTTTEFRWEGFLAGTILTVRRSGGDARVVLELEPVYDEGGVHMTGIGTRANSEGRRRIIELRYINSPRFDPLLAARFMGRSSTRGWAGNPFFHPFIWDDVFPFDLQYDDLGRIREAVPVAPDVTRPLSAFSERLTFTWEGASHRLLAVSGPRYRREMKYDKRGRLLSERISHPLGRGKIEYEYRGDSSELLRAVCEDDFYDRARRTVLLQSTLVR